MNDLTDAAVEAGESYDQLPYVSHPFSQMQPALLAGLGAMFGLGAGDVRKARVLEIGSASGGHLIPLALRFPDAYFLGIDPSQKQIEDGRARAAEFGLKNLDLRPIGVEALDEKDGLFDFILCHGVYSWVPETVQTAIFASIKKHLAPKGIAYVSYNVLPGWFMRHTVRESLLLTTSEETDVAGKIRRAREMIGFLERSTDEDTIWGKIWRQEAAELSGHRDDYIGHEFLESENSPCSFIEFAGTAHEHGLTYLCETELFTMIPENGGVEAGAEMRKITGNRLFAMEQMLDLVNGRVFRQTLLVHAECADRIDRSLGAERLNGLHLAASIDIAPTRAESKKAKAWKDGKGCWYESSDSRVIAAVRQMIERLPATVTPEELTAGMDDEARKAVMSELLKMLTIGLLEVSSEPVECLARAGAKPKVFEIARIDAARGRSSSANVLHAIVELGKDARMVLPLCDGSRDVNAICQELDRQRKPGAKAVNIREKVENVLLWASKNALLVP